MDIDTRIVNILRPFILMGFDLARSTMEFQILRDKDVLLKIKELGWMTPTLAFMLETIDMKCESCGELLHPTCPRAICKHCSHVNNIISNSSELVCQGCSAKTKGECTHPKGSQRDKVQHNVKVTGGIQNGDVKTRETGKTTGKGRGVKET